MTAAVMDRVAGGHQGGTLVLACSLSSRRRRITDVGRHDRADLSDVTVSTSQGVGGEFIYFGGIEEKSAFQVRGHGFDSSLRRAFV